MVTLPGNAARSGADGCGLVTCGSTLPPFSATASPPGRQPAPHSQAGGVPVPHATGSFGRSAADRAGRAAAKANAAPAAQPPNHAEPIPPGQAHPHPNPHLHRFQISNIPAAHPQVACSYVCSNRAVDVRRRDSWCYPLECANGHPCDRGGVIRAPDDV